MKFKSWRIHYADGSVASGSDLAGWILAKADEIQVVTIFFEETYEIYKQDGYDSAGLPINPRLETENYCQILAGQDYYYFAGAERYGGVAAADLTPELLAPLIGSVKTGSTVREALFYAAYEAADRKRIA